MNRQTASNGVDGFSRREVLRVMPRQPVVVPEPIPVSPLQTAPAPKKTRKFSKLSRWIKRVVATYRQFYKEHRLGVRISATIMAAITIVSGIIGIGQERIQIDKYNIARYENVLLAPPVDLYAQALKVDLKNQSLHYNTDYQPSSEVTGDNNSPKVSADFSSGVGSPVTITDPVNKVGLTFTSKFALDSPRKNKNRVVYPVMGKNASVVYTLQASGVKEDIILDSFMGDKLEFVYDLGLSEGTEAKIESDGSLAVYGVDSTLLGNITTGSEEDAALLKEARKNAQKTKLIFSVPAPFVFGADKKTSKGTRAWFTLDGTVLTVHTAGLRGATYPLSIDPSVYVETAAKLMRGNNETNTDFDVSNELIQKSQTTGARINAWSPTKNLDTSIWGQSTAVAGGYIYSVGGQETYKKVLASPGASYFKVPTGTSSITVKMWGGAGGGGAGDTGAGGAGGAGGYVTAVLSVSAGETLNVYAGGGGGGGTTTTAGGTGGAGGGFSKIDRAGTNLILAAGGGGGGGGRAGTSTAGGAGGAGGGTTGVAGSASGAAGGGGAGTPSTFGAGGTGGTNPGTAGASEAGGAGGDGRTPSGVDGSGIVGGLLTGGASGLGAVTANYAGAGGGGAGLYGGGGGSGSSTNTTGGGGGGGGSSYTDPGATSVTNTAGSGVTPGNSGDSDRNGAGTGGGGGAADTNGTAGADGLVVITYTVSGNSTATTNKVLWAKFNPNSSAIDSPNPGAGTCNDWCTDPAYNLPVALKNLSLVAYNGFLYAIGGNTSAGTRVDTVYIAKLGANGEPSLWNPTGGTAVYWYSDTALSSITNNAAAVAYNNRIYLIGGQSSTGVTAGLATVLVANINPPGTLGLWAATTALPSGRHSLSAVVYNDTMYVIGGATTTTPQTTVYYSKINQSNGSLAAWTTTTALSTARASQGGSYATIWGAYIYLSGGCTTLNASQYCTAMDSTVQLASINADGSIGEWGSMTNLTNTRVGYSLIAWQNGLYRLGGCASQNTGTGVCDNTLSSVDYGVINGDGDASTVSNSEPANTSPCSGATPTNCDLPGAGDGAQQGGQMASMVAINNGFIYVIGGCTNVAANNVCESGGTAQSSGNVMYAALNSTGTMSKPAACTGGTYVTNSLWCVDSTHTVNGTAGIATGSSSVFNNVLYVIGGTNGSTWNSNVYYVALSADGSLSGNWTAQTFATLDLGTARGYSFAFTRANPTSAATYPGNLYVMGGCNGGSTTADGIGCTTYYTEVYKCNITTTGALEVADANDCTTTGQMQIDADNLTGGAQGLGLMAGAIYANRVYLVGGSCPSGGAAGNPCGSTYAANRKDTIYATIDDSNNIVDSVSGSSGGTWKFTTGQMNPVRRRGVSFGYNGYIYSLAGYSGTSSLQDLLFAKIDVSTGDMGSFSSSGVVVTPRWDLRAIVSNGYVYAIGGCGAGSAPSGCTAMQPEIQTFQLYNNDSGAPVSFGAGANLFTTDRMGSSSTILNGYIYVAGGCTVTSGSVCTTAIDSVQYAKLDDYGAIGAWAATSDATIGAVRAFGQLETVGGSLYYIGGQSSTATDERAEVYYATPITSGASKGDITTWSGATNDLPDGRTQHTAAVWNNRIYVLGGVAATGGAVSSVVYASPALPSGGDITSAWTTTGMTAFNVARSGLSSVAYANNLYIFGGYNGTRYLNDTQYASLGYKTGTLSQSGTAVTGSGTTWTSAMIGSVLQYQDGSVATITARSSNTAITVDVSKTVSAGTTYVIQDGSVGAWSYSTSLPGGLRQAEGFAANGYMYLVGGRSADTTCAPNMIVAPISANTTIASGNNPTGIGEWYETNVKYTGDRFGAGVSYYKGKVYVTGGGCGATGTLTGANRVVQTAVKAQPQLATYSRMIDTDTDVFPTKWLMNGLDNSIGARWQLRYRTAADDFTGGTNLIFDEDYGGTVPVSNGDAIGDGNTDYVGCYDNPTSAKVFDNTWTKGGTYSGKYTTTGGSGNNGCYNNFSTITKRYERFYFRFDTPPTSNTNIYNVTDRFGGPDRIAELRVTPAGTLQLRDSFTVDPLWTNMVLEQGVKGNRLEIGLVNDNITVRLYKGDNVDGVIPDDVQTVPLTNSTGNDFNQINVGILTSGGTWALWLDEHKAATDGWVGSASTGAQWGQETNWGDVTLGNVEDYIPLDGGGDNTNFARWYFFYITIDASQTFGYPEDVSRGPTLTDLSLFFTADPSKRLRHGKTFTGGELQPLDTPCGSPNPNCL